MNSATKLFYSLDQLDSAREMTDNSGANQAEYAFDPYGRTLKIAETTPADFGYGSYYIHARSGLNLTLNRAYSSLLGRFINRDPIEEEGGTNLFSYLDNDPTNDVDLFGLKGGKKKPPGGKKRPPSRCKAPPTTPPAMPPPPILPGYPGGPYGPPNNTPTNPYLPPPPSGPPPAPLVLPPGGPGTAA